MRPALKIVPGRREVAPEEAVLETRDLSMAFPATDGELTVLEEITFTAGAGEMFCILGPSGCGKSTPLKILAGFLRPTGGAATRAGAVRGFPGGRPVSLADGGGKHRLWSEKPGSGPQGPAEKAGLKTAWEEPLRNGGVDGRLMKHELY
ncbi:MAG: ATP-binding cassette domain-containing protein [Thermodesulfobacteriota bacterium]